MSATAAVRPVWSYTRSEVLRTCPRRYYFTYVAAPRGRETRAVPEDRAATLLSRLTTIPLALGAAVHARAREVAHAVLAGAELPSESTLLKRSRAEMNRLWRASGQREAFLRAEPGSAMLAEVFYGHSPGPETFARARERLGRCTEVLLSDPVWEELRGLPRASVHVLDRPIRWDQGSGTYWAAPDLVFTDHTGRVAIVDWKTGRVGADVRDQLAVYAWFARERLRLPGAEQSCAARIAALDCGGGHTVTITEQEASSAGSRARAELDRFRTLAAEERSSFALASRKALCPRCPFWALCEAEIREVKL